MRCFNQEYHLEFEIALSQRIILTVTMPWVRIILTMPWVRMCHCSPTPCSSNLIMYSVPMANADVENRLCEVFYINLIIHDCFNQCFNVQMQFCANIINPLTTMVLPMFPAVPSLCEMVVQGRQHTTYARPEHAAASLASLWDTIQSNPSVQHKLPNTAALFLLINPANFCHSQELRFDCKYSRTS